MVAQEKGLKILQNTYDALKQVNRQMKETWQDGINKEKQTPKKV
jgi:hypothetical protein